ncbi:MAG: helix-turn-helix transcriptional regulator [Euryarchaeota archaeon]|jgi:DNA-binding transcriptional ArsR family regulator|nr:helix-turn-helix transcriptional regulator [Euryarchaeota archaeon]
MEEFGPDPSSEALDAEREQWDGLDTRQRVRQVVTGCRDPTSVAEIAARAGCSENAARKHLVDLADLGVVERHSKGRSNRYARNNEYVRWRQANELVTNHSSEKLFAQLRELEEREAVFRDEYGVGTPNEVAFPDNADHETIHERWEETGEWATIRWQIEIHRDALRMAKRRRDGLPA